MPSASSREGVLKCQDPDEIFFFDHVRLGSHTAIDSYRVLVIHVLVCPLGGGGSRSCQATEGMSRSTSNSRTW